MACTLKFGAGKPHEDYKDPADGEDICDRRRIFSKTIRIGLMFLIIGTWPIHFCIVFNTGTLGSLSTFLDIRVEDDSNLEGGN
jgi:hypothetical protein